MRNTHETSLRTLPAALLCLLLLGSCLVVSAQPTPAAAAVTNAPARAESAFIVAKAKFDAAPNDAELGWQFARAAFDWAEFSTSDKQREEIALQGIAAARRSVVLNPKSAAAHYYLSMNLGQLARTKSIGALRLVPEMEKEFLAARELDRNFDYAGPDRNLGLLYLEAPSFSVGDRKKARIHLLKAVELSGRYPENRINLIEAYLRWGETKLASAELELLEKLLPAAREQFSGDRWQFTWADWERRLHSIRKAVKTVR